MSFSQLLSQSASAILESGSRPLVSSQPSPTSYLGLQVSLLSHFLSVHHCNEIANASSHLLQRQSRLRYPSWRWYRSAQSDRPVRSSARYKRLSGLGWATLYQGLFHLRCLHIFQWTLSANIENIVGLGEQTAR